MYKTLKTIKNIVFFSPLTDKLLLQKSDNTLDICDKESLNAIESIDTKEIIKNAVQLNDQIYYIGQETGSVFNLRNPQSPVHALVFYDLIIKDSELIAIVSDLDFSTLDFTFELVNVFKNKIFMHIEGMKIIHLLDEIIVVSNEKNIGLYQIQSGDELTVSETFIHNHYEHVIPLTRYQDVLVCNTDNEKLVGIDIKTGTISWEVSEKFDKSGEVLENFSLPAFSGKVNDKLILCSGIIYSELNLATKRFVVETYFSDVPNSSSSEIFIRQSAIHDGLLYFTSQNNKTKKWNTVGIFDTSSKEIIWKTELDLPQGVFLNQLPRIDGQHLYIKDSANTLHIFEKE